MTQQTYDSALKSILEEHAIEIMPLLLSGIEIGEELNDETLRPSLRADRVSCTSEKNAVASSGVSANIPLSISRHWKLSYSGKVCHSAKKRREEPNKSDVE